MREVNEELYNMLMIGMFYKSSPDIDELIDRAYRDMAAHTLRGIPDKNKRQRLRKEGKEWINGRIKALKQETCGQNEYDTWHLETCRKLIGIYDGYYKNDEVKLSFGQAQKWVNMTMKYLCMVKPEKYKWIEKDWKCYLHFPMDNYILKHFWKYTCEYESSVPYGKVAYCKNEKGQERLWSKPRSNSHNIPSWSRYDKAMDNSLGYSAEDIKTSEVKCKSFGGKLSPVSTYKMYRYILEAVREFCKSDEHCEDRKNILGDGKAISVYEWESIVWNLEAETRKSEDMELEE